MADFIVQCDYNYQEKVIKPMQISKSYLDLANRLRLEDPNRRLLIISKSSASDFTNRLAFTKYQLTKLNKDPMEFTTSNIVKLMGKRPDVVVCLEYLEQLSFDQGVLFLGWLKSQTHQETKIYLTAQMFGEVKFINPKRSYWSYEALYYAIARAGMTLKTYTKFKRQTMFEIAADIPLHLPAFPELIGFSHDHQAISRAIDLLTDVK